VTADAEPAPRRALGVRDAVLFLLAAALSASTIWFEIGPHDEGLMLQAAHRIASGELPYRDFWWNYAPGQPLLLGAVDAALGGPSLLAWRILRVLLDATVALLAYRLAARPGSVPTPQPGAQNLSRPVSGGQTPAGGGAERAAAAGRGLTPPLRLTQEM
jgi:hypothetical protein